MKSVSFLKSALSLSALLLALTACEVGADYQAPDAGNLPVTWDAAAAQQETDKADIDQSWWNNFHDPVLTGLIDKAAAGAPDLQIAAARIGEARAQLASSYAALLPTGDVKSTATREANQFAFPGGTSGPFGSLLTKPFNFFQNGFDASWEVDLFGENRRAAEAAGALLESAQAARDDAMVSLLAEVARTYVDIRNAQAQIAIADNSLTSERKTLSIARQRVRVGDAPGLDATQAEAAVEQAQTQLPANRALLAQAEYSMDALVGEQPGYTRQLIVTAAPIPVSDKALVAAAPATVIAQRPDIRMAERRLAAATAQQGVAVAKFFPKISLSGFFGSLTTDGTQILSGGSESWQATGGLVWPILSYGNLSANLDAADAQQQEVMASYQKTVLGALADVNRALAAYHEQQIYLQATAAAADKDARARMVALERYREGLTSFIDVLDADRTLYAAQSQLAKARADSAQDLIALYKSLGGGWQKQDPAH